MTRAWANSFPGEAAVYLFREDGEVCYVGETGSLQGRMNDILDTRNHTARRNLGRSLYSDLPDYERASSKRSFPPEIEAMLNDRIREHLMMSYILVDLGRKELKEMLFDKLQPKYSVKGKRGKKFTKSEKQLLHANAYESWSKSDDEKLELLFCGGKSIKELSEIFGRNNGAIRSRIKKLELKEKYES